MAHWPVFQLVEALLLVADAVVVGGEALGQTLLSLIYSYSTEQMSTRRLLAG